MGGERFLIGRKTKKMLMRTARVETRLVVDPSKLAALGPQQQEFARNLIKHPTSVLAPRLIPKTEIVPTMEKFLGGSMVNWQADDGIEKAVALRDNPRSVWNSLHYSISQDLHSSESNQAMRLFAQDLKSFPITPALFTSPALTEWSAKFSFGLSCMTGFYLQRDMTSEGLSGDVQAFCRSVEDQTQSFTQACQRLELPQTVSLLKLFDVGYRVSAPNLDPAISNIQNLVVQHSPDYQVLTAKMREGPLKAWNKLKNHWDWATIAQVLAALPNFKSPNTLLLAVGGLELNLTKDSEKLSRNSSLPKSLDPDGVIRLLGFNWAAQETPTIDTWLDEHLAYLGAPRKYVPSTAIELLTRFGQASQPENFSHTLREVGSRVENGLVAPWLVTLLALRGAGLAPDDINKAVAGYARQTSRTCQILLDQTPGTVWITPDRKLHPRDTDTSLQKGYPLYTSSAKAQKVDAEAVKVAPTEAHSLKVAEVSGDQILNLPFVGEVAVVPNEQVANLTNLIFGRNQTLDLDKLFEEFDFLSAKWKANTHNRPVFYNHQLNPSDRYMREAAKLGVESVYLEGDKVFFIVDTKLAQAQTEGKVLNPAILSYIDRGGQLHLMGMDESFMASEAQLMLNNLALHLYTKPLYMSGFTKTDGKDKAADRAINATIASWNRSISRGTRPKIGLSPNNCIAISVDGIDMPVLLGEASK